MGKSAASTPGVLTRRQQQVKTYIGDFISKNGYSPSYADIAKKLKVHVSAVSYHLLTLEKKGHVSRVAGVSRSIRVVD